MAVVVQRMQPSLVAGVAFSADPVTGQRCVIIEAAPGRPDAVVGGRVRPSRWRIDARGILVETREAQDGESLLSQELVLELASSVRRIDGRFMEPVDVEWLWDGERFLVSPGAPDHHARGAAYLFQPARGGHVPGTDQTPALVDQHPGHDPQRVRPDFR